MIPLLGGFLAFNLCGLVDVAVWYSQSVCIDPSWRKMVLSVDRCTPDKEIYWFIAEVVYVPPYNGHYR
jgi:hypothetical protein